MRIHVTLDDLPEFESFNSMWLALRGAAWSITNTPLRAELTDDQVERILDALSEVEDVLAPLRKEEESRLTAQQEAKRRFIHGEA